MRELTDSLVQVAWIAFEEWRHSKKLDSFMKETFGDSPPFAWSRAHSHLALMGGFSFDTGGDSSIPLPQTRYTLTSVGICFLAKHRPDLIPNITTDAINDKSKASPLAKLLVFTQALWFCLQILSRLAVGLPITALELNTFAHALFAFFAFAAWWHKPLDIHEAVLIPLVNNPSATSLCAAMYLRSTVGYLRSGRLLECSWPRPDLDAEPKPIDTVDNDHAAATTEAGAPDIPPITLKAGESKQGFGFRYTEGSAGSDGNKIYEWQPRASSGWHFTDTLEISGETQRCYHLAQESVLKYTSLQADPYATFTVEEDEETLETDCASPGWRNDYLRTTCSNWPRRIKIGTVISGADEFAALLWHVACGTVYGGIHLLAWNGSLHTEAELLLWRVASLTLFASGGLVLLCVVGYRLHKALEDFIIYAPLGAVLHCMVVVIAFLGTGPAVYGGLLYLISRVYILIEGFISLPFVPDEAYLQPKWTEYFPHFR